MAGTDSGLRTGFTSLAVRRCQFCYALAMSAALLSVGCGGGSSATPSEGRSLTPTLRVFAGILGSPGAQDGTGAAARFYSPTGLASDANGNLYVADTFNHLIRKISTGGDVTTLAGAPGMPHGSTDGSGPAASFYHPSAVATDAVGNVYVASNETATIRKVTSAGVVSTLAGKANGVGSVDGTVATALFWSPAGVAIDLSGNLYVTEQFACTVRKITPAGLVTTLAGTAGTSGSIDGSGAVARFQYPTGVATDNQGNVYVADTFNHTIRKISPDGVVTTLAGKAGNSGSADGTGPTARFNQPSGLAIDFVGNVYVADTLNHTIRKITPAGVVTTVAGQAGIAAFLPGALPGALNYPSGVALQGNKLFVTVQNAIAVIENLP